MTKRIFVDRRAIELNQINREDRPVYTVQLDDGSFASGMRVDIHGPSRLVYSTTHKVNGARCWVETEADITIHKDA